MPTHPVLTRAERRVYYVDRHGVIRRRSTGRRRRSDYGTRKPHPAHCRHCESVRDYRDTRDTMLTALGGFRNETAHTDPVVISFKEWLIRSAREKESLPLPSPTQK